MRVLAIVSAVILFLPVAVMAAPVEKEEKLGPSVNNPWLGAQVGLKIAGKGDFADRIGGSALVRLQGWKHKSLSIPLYGNISRLATPDAIQEAKQILENLVQSSEGLHIRLVPNYQFGDPKKKGTSLWASVGWHMTAAKDTTGQSTEVHEGRLGVGAEISIPSESDTSKPTTLSIEGVAHIADGGVLDGLVGRDISSFQSLEFTGIVPISASDVGLMVEGIVSNHHVPSVWRIGLVFASGQTPK